MLHVTLTRPVGVFALLLLLLGVLAPSSVLATGDPVGALASSSVLATGDPLGACCFPDCSCAMMTAPVCDQNGGVYLGDGTVCDPNPCECPPATGACCFEDGRCENLTFDECAGGDYLGDDSVCDPNPCPGSGACCYEGGACWDTSPAQCETTGGTFLGEDIGCDPNPCPLPERGACCFDETCRFFEEEECLDNGGVYLGDDSDCEVNPCAIVPTQEDSWGAIKGIYRQG